MILTKKGWLSELQINIAVRIHVAWDHSILKNGGLQKCGPSSMNIQFADLLTNYDI